MTHEHLIEDARDTALIKARRMPHHAIECLPVVPDAASKLVSIPAPKVWRRSERKQQCSPAAVDAAKLQSAHAEARTEPVREIAASNMDEWTRDFLVLVELNET